MKKFNDYLEAAKNKERILAFKGPKNGLYDKYEVGDKLVATPSGPGIGKVIYKITKKDKEKLYGIEIKNTTQVLEPNETK